MPPFHLHHKDFGHNYTIAYRDYSYLPHGPPDNWDMRPLKRWETYHKVILKPGHKASSIKQGNFPPDSLDTRPL